MASRAFFIIILFLTGFHIFCPIWIHNHNLLPILPFNNLILQEISLEFEVIQHFLHNVEKHVCKYKGSSNDPQLISHLESEINLFLPQIKHKHYTKNCK